MYGWEETTIKVNGKYWGGVVREVMEPEEKFKQRVKDCKNFIYRNTGYPLDLAKKVVKITTRTRIV